MKIIFVKQYIDHDTFDSPLVIEPGEKGELLDEVTGRVELTEGYWSRSEITGVPTSVYVEDLGPAK